jgi:signal transduction histidine kinase
VASETSQREKHNEEYRHRLEDLISVFSHDLRTPLLAIRVTLRSMSNGAFGDLSPEFQEALEDYQTTNEDLLKLVERLLDVSRYQVGGSKALHYEILNWEKIIERASEQCDRVFENKCRISFSLEPYLPKILGDSI